MLYDIKDELVKKYLQEMEFMRKSYNDDCNRFFCKVDKKIVSCMGKVEKIKLKHKNDGDFCIYETEEYQVIIDYEELKYHYLSSVLQSLASLWENQMNDFYLLEKRKGFNELKMQFKNDKYYNIDSDEGLKEIVAVYNYLKHGQFGKAENDLKVINSKYYYNNNINGEIRGMYFRNKQLMIDIKDIDYFANMFIDFWMKVLEKL